MRYNQEQSRGPPTNIFANNNNLTPFQHQSQGIVGSRSQNRIHVHSNPNGMNFNGFNGGHMADEQLL